MALQLHCIEDGVALHKSLVKRYNLGVMPVHESLKVILKKSYRY